MMIKTFIIAEAGVNHNGSLETACRMIDSAAAAGADAVKFQTFRAESLISPHAPKALYQRENTNSDESQFQMLKKLELDESSHLFLFRHCQRNGIQFLSTAFDLESIDLLNRLGLASFKIPSGEITNLPYLKKVGALRKQLFLSTGMADLKEIRDALDILAEVGTTLKNITVLHCNTAYPTPFEDVNLKAMLTIRDSFPGISVGYSDHTSGIEVPIAAVAMGASVIEKHFTLNRTLPGPDQAASLEPAELTAMISAIRNIERALGTGIKQPSPSELVNRPYVRKSIIAATKILKGELFNETNLGAKRVAQSGISPMRWNELIGRPSKRNYEADEVIEG